MTSNPKGTVAESTRFQGTCPEDDRFELVGVFDQTEILKIQNGIFEEN